MRCVTGSLFALTLVLCSVVQADVNELTVETGDFDVVGGYFQIAEYGCYKGSSFFDVSTRTSTYAYWGLARWDLTTAKAELDAAFGSGDWEVTKLVLQMCRTSYTYSNDGWVTVRYTHDDDTDYLRLCNLTDGVSEPVGGQLVNDPCDANGTYVKIIWYENEGDNYELLQYELYNDVNDPTPNAGQQMMLKDIRHDNTVTLCFVDDPNDFALSAAWAGPANSYPFQRPRLFITAKPSLTHVPVCSDQPAMDTDDDCIVTLADFSVFAGQWFECGYADPNDCGY